MLHTPIPQPQRDPQKANAVLPYESTGDRRGVSWGFYVSFDLWTALVGALFCFVLLSGWHCWRGPTYSTDSRSSTLFTSV